MNDPPVAPFGVAAHEYREAMVARADGVLNGGPVWNGWALVEAFEAGRAGVTIESVLAGMSAEDRASVFTGLGRYCQCCGGEKLPCHCWNDE